MFRTRDLRLDVVGRGQRPAGPPQHHRDLGPLTPDEELRILERAQFLYECGLPGMGVGLGVTLFGIATQDFTTLLIGGGIGTASMLMLQLGKHYKDKVLP